MNAHAHIEPAAGAKAPNVEMLTGSSGPSGTAPAFEPIASGTDAKGDELLARLSAEFLDLQREDQRLGALPGDIKGKRKTTLNRIWAQMKAIAARMAALKAQSMSGLSAKAAVFSDLDSITAHEFAPLAKSLADDTVRLGAERAATPDRNDAELFAKVDVGRAFLARADKAMDARDVLIADAWAEYQRVRPLEKAAYEREAALDDRAQREGPKRPDAMVPRSDDFPEDSIRFVSECVDGISYYTSRVIEVFRTKPRTRMIFDRGLEPGNFVDQVQKRVPCPKEQARADEIVAAYDQWVTDKARFREEIGLPKAREEADALGEQVDQLSKVIRETPALSLLGIQIKAAWAKMLLEQHEDDEDLAAVLDQIEAFGNRYVCLQSHSGIKTSEQGLSFSPDRRALEAYRTWLSNEFRSLSAEMYPDQPEMTGAVAVNNTGDKFHFRGESPASSRAERLLTILGLDWKQDDRSVFADRQAAA